MSGNTWEYHLRSHLKPNISSWCQNAFAPAPPTGEIFDALVLKTRILALDSRTISWETHCDHDSLSNCEVIRPTQWQWFTTVDRKRHLYNQYIQHQTPCGILWPTSILWCSWFVQNKARLIASVWISLWQTAKCISSSQTDFIILVVKGYNNQHLKERPLSTVSGHLPRTFAQYAFKGQRLANFWSKKQVLGWIAAGYRIWYCLPGAADKQSSLGLRTKKNQHISYQIINILSRHSPIEKLMWAHLTVLQQIDPRTPRVPWHLPER